ncbi:MAG TPA: hypothetical protein PL064_12900, partial [Thermogutta sp.]|nr:hypothetical protein [Thermogutta sp.]
RMITAWRAAFRDPQLAFCIIALPTAGEPQTAENFVQAMYDVGPYIREAQYRTFRNFYDAGDKAIGYVSTYDLRKSWYHPQIKIPVGERAAKWALVTQYGILSGRDAEQYWLPPSITRVEAVDGTLRLYFSTEVRTKDDADGKLLGFAIAGEDRRFFPADVRYYTEKSDDGQNQPREQRHILVLSSPFVPQPVHYRYAWARNPMGNIVNSRGVPLATQRSDNWILEETPEKIPVPQGMSPETAQRYIGNRLRELLKQADLERRYLEAKRTLQELAPLVERGKTN